MDNTKIRLLRRYNQLVEMKCASETKFDHQCQIKDLTFKQIEYLKIIDKHELITISELAQEVDNSKPTVTEMVKKFISLDCVYKVKCSSDARKAYLQLTDRGIKIARMEDNILSDLLDKIFVKLTDEEIETLIHLLDKTVSD